MLDSMQQTKSDQPQAQSADYRAALTGWAETFWRPETGIFLGVWLMLLVGGRERLFRDPGTFWHTVVGERILSTGEFLDHDPFSYTFGGQPWVPYEWLGECAMALIHRVDGFDSLLLAATVGIACLFTWAAHRLLRSGLHWSLTALVIVLLFAASTSHLHVRPHLLTIAFLGITFAWLVDFEAGRIAFRRLLWLIPLFIVWTNTHGGMLGGLGTMVLALVGWCVWRLLGLHSPLRNRRSMLDLAVLIAVCGLTALVNPYGIELPRTWYTILHAPLLPEIIQEHAPLNPTRPDGLMVLGFGLVYVLVLAGVHPRQWRVTWLLPLAWLVLACLRIRHAPLFAITATLALADLLPCTWWARWLARPGSDLFRFPSGAWRESGAGWSWRPALLPLALVGLAFGLQAAHAPVPVLGHGWARHDPDLWPVELLPELRRQAEARPGTPIFNEYEYGGFLIYHAPQLRVYVDDRCEIYGDQWLYEYVQAESNPGPYLDERQRQYGPFDLALTRTGSGYDRYFDRSAEWTVLGRTATATLYRRADRYASQHE
jgi:hypothetical protein